jgi:hypothetical protein
MRIVLSHCSSYDFYLIDENTLTELFITRTNTPCKNRLLQVIEITLL